MKFIRKLIVSLFIYSVVKAQNDSSSEFSRACRAEMTNIEKCISQRITKENIGTVCRISKTSYCQRFYSNPMRFLPSCQKFKEIIITSTQVFTNSLSLMCETDEMGRLCPYTQYEINNMSLSNNTPENALNAIRNSCPSTKCRRATRKYIQFLINNNDKLIRTIDHNYTFENLGSANSVVVNNLKTYLQILNSPDCPPPLNNAASSSSSQNTITKNNSSNNNNINNNTVNNDINNNNNSNINNNVNNSNDNNVNNSNIDTLNNNINAAEDPNIINPIANNNNNSTDITNNSTIVPANNTMINANTTSDTPQVKTVDNTNGTRKYITKTTIISFVIYMIIYFGVFKFVFM